MLQNSKKTHKTSVLNTSSSSDTCVNADAVKGRSKTKTPAPLSLRTRALRLLSRREFTRKELEGRLIKFDSEGLTADSLTVLLDDLESRGWLSDQRYAQAFVRRRVGQYAKAAIAQQLKRAGVGEEDRQQVLEEMGQEDEFDFALSLAERKFRQLPTDDKSRARVLRFLQSRGYAIGLGLRVLKQLGQKK